MSSKNKSKELKTKITKNDNNDTKPEPTNLVIIAIQLIAFGLIGVCVFYSHWIADVVFQSINLFVAIVRATAPSYDPSIAFLQHLRIASRALRPFAHAATAIASLSSNGGGSILTIFPAGNAVYDGALLCVGLAMMLDLSENIVQWARAFFRETWVVFAVLRMLRNWGDPIVFASCALEMVVTQCFLFVYLTQRVLPMRVVGIMSIFISGQKLGYLLIQLKK